MAEVVVGDVVAKLRADVSQFSQALNDVIQRLATLNQATATLRQQQAQSIQATQQHAQQMRGVAQTFQQATTSAQGYRQALQQTTTQVGLLSQASRTAGSGLSTMFSVAGGIGIATGIGAIVSQMKDLAVSTVQTGTRLEALRASLSALGGGTTAGAQQFQFLVSTAQQLGVALEPLARGWRTLTAAATQAGLPLAEQQRLLTALTIEGRRVGASSDEVGRAIQAVGQMASKGVVSMEELRQQLGEALPTAMAAAATGMGRTTEELIKLIETGSVRFVPFAQGLTRGFEQMQAASGTFADGSREAFARLATAWKLLQDAIMGSGLSAYLVQVAKNLQNAVEWTTKLVKGPTPVFDLSKQAAGATPDQVREEQRLERLIALYQGQITPSTAPALREQREEMIARAREQLEQIQAAIRETGQQAQAQANVTQEANKTATALALQQSYVEGIRKTLQDMAKAQEALRANAANAPNVFGDPRGTSEQQQEFARRAQQLRQQQTEKIQEQVRLAPPGAVLPADLQAGVRALDQDYGKLGATLERLKEQDQARTRAASEAARAAQQAARQALHDQEAYQQAIDKTRMAIVAQEEQALATLKSIHARFFQDREARAIDVVAEIQERFPGNEAIQAQAAQTRASLETRDAYLEEVEALKERFTALKQNADALRTHEELTERFGQTVRDRLDVLGTPREERESTRLRQRAVREGVDLTPQLDEQLKLIDAQTRWNTIMGEAERLGDQAAQAITQGLMSIVDGTVAVADGFKQMAKSIMDSIAQVMVHEGFKMLIRMGLGLIGGTATGAGFSNTGASAGGGAKGFEILMAQGGAVLNKPTHILAGENPAMNPEYVVNRPQMQALIKAASQAGPSAGGQATSGGGISIINVSSREEAARTAAQEKAMGRQVVLNYIAEDLGQGSGSRLGNLIRTIQR